MGRTPKRPPSLEEALEKGFSELKIGEANLQPVPDASAFPEEKEQPQVAQPILYNQKFEAVEDREEFVVNNPSSQAKSNEQVEEVKVPVSKEASSTIGDEFDVEW